MKVKPWLAFTLFGVSSVVLAVGGSPLASHGEDHFKPSRASTDAPVPSRGKLGQDLFMAVGRRDLDGVKGLLKSGADPNSRNGLEFSPIYMAAASHQLDAMKVLVEAGADPNTKGVYGTPLLFAASTAHIEGVDYLLSLGADVNARRQDRMTALIEAADAGFPPLVADLLDHKADIDAKDTNGTTALALAARKGHMGAGQILLARGASVNTVDNEGQTPLMAAAINGHAEFVSALLAKGAQVDAKDKQGRTALIAAASFGDYPDVVKALLQGGADAKATDQKGRTAAAYAARHGYSATAKLLGTQLAVKAPSASVAISRSVKVMQESMRDFADCATCVSCHHEGLGRMVMGQVKSRGWIVDKKTAAISSSRVDGMVKGMQGLHEQALLSPEVMKQLPLIEINEIASTYSWILNGMVDEHEAPTPGSKAMTMCLARQQMTDGSWSFSVPRPPMQSSTFTFTALTIRALKAYAGSENAAEASRRIEQAKGWLLATAPKTMEDKAFRLLGLRWSGARRAEVEAAIKDVVAGQRPDGGWSQGEGWASDAYATGVSLYALGQGGEVSPRSSTYAKGVKFLLRTQDDDGSWYVVKHTNPNNNYFDANFPHGESQYSSFNGTCWATLALLDAAGKRVRKG